VPLNKVSNFRRAASRATNAAAILISNEARAKQPLKQLKP
jgi:hypothetical protein